MYKESGLPVPAPRPGHEVAFVISSQSSVGLSVLVSGGLCVKYVQGFIYLRKSVRSTHTHSLEERIHQSNNKSENTSKICYGLQYRPRNGKVSVRKPERNMATFLSELCGMKFIVLSSCYLSLQGHRSIGILNF